MKNHRHYFLLFLCCIPFFLIGQSQEEPLGFNYKNDISFNVTTLLGKMLSINDSESGVPYSFSYRRHNGKRGLRIAIATGISKSSRNEFEFSSSLKKTETNLRIGYEIIHPISRRITMMYGLDLTGRYETENSEIFNFQGNFSQEDLLWEAGGGPALRLSYNVNQRISFHTESSLYFVYGQMNTTFSATNIPDSSTDLWSLNLALPQALFITIAF